MKKLLLSVTTITVALLTLDACRHEPDLSGFPEVSFSQKIQPIIASNCAYSGCHDDGHGGSFSLEDYEDIIDHGDVKAGNPHGSLLFQVITNHGEKLMPPDGPLSSEDIQSIYLWIAQGAKNN